MRNFWRNLYRGNDHFSYFASLSCLVSSKQVNLYTSSANLQPVIAGDDSKITGKAEIIISTNRKYDKVVGGVLIF